MIALAEKRWLPDWLIRVGIRRLLRQRVDIESRRSHEDQLQFMAGFEKMLRESPVAVNTESANEQHYEVPPAFFERVLGPHLKYSCGWWDRSDRTLGESEQAMLQLTVERAAIQNGMRLLDIGCGWGSLSLYMARKFPESDVTGISNSNGQRQFIMDRAREEGLTNLEIITADMREFEFDGERKFDRALSVEMFEHMRNYELLLRRISIGFTMTENFSFTFLPPRPGLHV